VGGGSNSILNSNRNFVRGNGNLIVNWMILVSTIPNHHHPFSPSWISHI
jgi:hypothetical protein